MTFPSSLRLKSKPEKQSSSAPSSLRLKPKSPSVSRDVAEQSLSKGIAGAGGAYGDILDLLHAQSPEGAITSEQKQMQDVRSQIIDKLNRGETPSYGEMLLISELDEPIPLGSRFPSSSQVKRGIKELTGIGEGKTPAGRIAGRGAEFLGETAAFGGGGAKTLLTSLGAGLAGQGLREAGAPEELAALTEIVAPIGQAAVSKRLLPGKKAKDIVEAGRKIGLTESQITPLIQGEVKSSILSKLARKGSKTKRVFSEIKDTLGDSYTSIKNSPQAQKIIGGDRRTKLYDEFVDIQDKLSKTLASSPDRKAALGFIEEAIDSINNKSVTPEYLINFWQDINRSVNWNSISGGKKALAELKKPVLDALHKTSPELAKDFELTNKLYSKYSQINKKLKPGIVDSFINKAEAIGLPMAGWAFLTGNPLPLKAVATEAASRLLAREMLLSPYLQNISKKMVVNANQSSIQGIKNLANQVKKYMEKSHPKEDWDFLTEEASNSER